MIGAAEEGCRLDTMQVSEAAGITPAGRGSWNEGRRGSSRQRPDDRWPDELAYVLRRSGRIPPDVRETSAEAAVDADGRVLRFLVRDARSGRLLLELTPAELSRLADEQRVYQGLLVERRG